MKRLADKGRRSDKIRTDEEESTYGQGYVPVVFLMKHGFSLLGNDGFILTEVLK